jgi:hypothetical protein
VLSDEGDYLPFVDVHDTPFNARMPPKDFLISSPKQALSHRTLRTQHDPTPQVERKRGRIV